MIIYHVSIFFIKHTLLLQPQHHEKRDQQQQARRGALHLHERHVPWHHKRGIDSLPRGLQQLIAVSYPQLQVRRVKPLLFLLVWAS